MSDSLQSVRMVTGAGELLTASATENSDLFWGLRGAGHNFGIIVNATYTVYPFTNNGQAMSADMRFAISKNQSIWEFVKSYSDNQPDELTFDLGIAYDARFGGVSTRTLDSKLSKYADQKGRHTYYSTLFMSGHWRRARKSFNPY